jgi:hypothetical protein
MIGIIIFMAGAKEESRSEPFSDPRVAVGEELNLMTTFFEMRKGTKNKRRARFLKGLKRRKRTGKSGKEFWKWIPGYEGRRKLSNKGRVKIIQPTKPAKGMVNRTIPETILNSEEAKKFLAKLKKG